MKGKTITLVIALLLLAASNMAFSRSYVVIVHPSNLSDTIFAKDLKKIFLGEKIAWDDGKQIKVAVLKNGDAHNEFLKDIVKMPNTKFSMYWKRVIFTGSGTGVHITFFKTDEKVKEYVGANPTAIACIASQFVDDTVKTVKIRE